MVREKTRLQNLPRFSVVALLLGAALCRTDPSATCAAQECLHDQALLVAPIDEISIIDPGTNSTGKPEPLINGSSVEIPPTVIVHKYYYSGDRDFRGPVFPGGPSIVVVQHPCTGEKLYLDVQMLPGSPRVVYRKHAIEYHFGRQLVQIHFFNPLHPLHPCQPTVKYCQGSETIMKSELATTHKAKAVAWIKRTGLPSACDSAAKGTHSLVEGGADGIHKTGKIAVQPFKRLLDSTALSGIFNRSEEQSATQARDRSVQDAQKLSESRDQFIPTQR
ncbi:MAG TPA: hypothetical protein PLY87_07275 [Planctomycetaceae bacterium]|mgnify:CR=1 FL=1|nr:hypothetical protein [Planctomycetaceae bacterium]HQZ64858.1 hypothetical protein [Planctomycetaceae bacterium]